MDKAMVSQIVQRIYRHWLPYDSAMSLSLKDKVRRYCNYWGDKWIGGAILRSPRFLFFMTRLWKVNVLILTTRGRRSGKTRTTILQFFPDGGNIVIVAANSGRSSNPDWFYNLKASPTTQVQIMNRTQQVHAEELSKDEAIAFWPRILRVAPPYQWYRKVTSRTIPLLRLTPVGQAGEQTMLRRTLANQERNFIII
jgi:deazaflavin-dependent oxidoreductase (nitroreductase family)